MPGGNTRSVICAPAPAGHAVHRTGLDARSAHHRRPDPFGRGCRAGNGALRDLFYFDLVARGIWLAKRGMFALSIALDHADGDKLVDAVEGFAQTRAPPFQCIGTG